MTSEMEKKSFRFVYNYCETLSFACKQIGNKFTTNDNYLASLKIYYVRIK